MKSDENETGDQSANQPPVDKLLAAEASSAHARVNIPLNLQNWKHLSEDAQSDLTWLHQHILDRGLGWKEATEALGYDRSTIFRVLKGTYTGSLQKVQQAIRSFKKLTDQRGGIQRNEFVETGMSRLIFAGLDYAMANNSITMIIGESRMGKTISVAQWRDLNNHGRSVMLEVPPYGGTKALLTALAAVVGVNRNLNIVSMMEAILRSFNRNRILLVDEAHRLLPNDRRTNPTNLEILRHIHDKTGAALALVATARFEASLKGSEYQFEQIVGRIGMPIRLPRTIKEKDIAPIVSQFLDDTNPEIMRELLQMANRPGRLGIVVETLKVASRIASKAKQKLAEDHVRRAIALRQQMQGETNYSAKEEK